MVVEFQSGDYFATELTFDMKEELLQAQKLRYREFVDRNGWVEGNQARIDRDRYDVYAYHFVITDAVAHVVGTVRLLWGDRSPFMLNEDFTPLVQGVTVKRDSDHIEISRLAIDSSLTIPEKFAVSMCLYRGMYMWSVIHSVRYWYIVVEPHFFRVLRRLRFPFRQIGRDFSFQEGVVTRVALLDLKEAEEVIKREYPQRFAWFKEGLPIATS